MICRVDKAPNTARAGRPVATTRVANTETTELEAIYGRDMDAGTGLQEIPKNKWPPLPRASFGEVLLLLLLFIGHGCDGYETAACQIERNVRSRSYFS